LTVWLNYHPTMLKYRLLTNIHIKKTKQKSKYMQSIETFFLHEKQPSKDTMLLLKMSQNLHVIPRNDAPCANITLFVRSSLTCLSGTLTRRVCTTEVRFIFRSHHQ
jgi:hypothetical protein